MAKKRKISPLAKMILKGLEQALAHAKGEPDPRTRETIVYREIVDNKTRNDPPRKAHRTSHSK